MPLVVGLSLVCFLREMAGLLAGEAGDTLLTESIPVLLLAEGGLAGELTPGSTSGLGDSKILSDSVLFPHTNSTCILSLPTRDNTLPPFCWVILGMSKENSEAALGALVAFVEAPLCFSEPDLEVFGDRKKDFFG